MIFFSFWKLLALKVRILHILTIFTQVTTRLKNFLMGWLLVLGLKEGLVECATVCVKSEVILGDISLQNKAASKKKMPVDVLIAREKKTDSQKKCLYT